MDAEPLLHVKRLNSSLYWRPNSYVPIFLTRCYKEFFFFVPQLDTDQAETIGAICV